MYLSVLQLHKLVILLFQTAYMEIKSHFSWLNHHHSTLIIFKIGLSTTHWTYFYLFVVFVFFFKLRDGENNL